MQLHLILRQIGVDFTGRSLCGYCCVENIFGKGLKSGLNFFVLSFRFFLRISKYDITILVSTSHGNRSLTSYTFERMVPCICWSVQISRHHIVVTPNSKRWFQLIYSKEKNDNASIILWSPCARNKHKKWHFVQEDKLVLNVPNSQRYSRIWVLIIVRPHLSAQLGQVN